ncbi:MAG TPA: glutamate synthase subunit beta [Rhodothermia bacterium]|nr:glutamate synthase subunit beta [Rhodothermia bacterium]
MGNPVGFLEHPRELPPRRPVSERLADYREVYLPFPEDDVRRQASRCMDCGVPFCQAGCPLGNAIPDWNDLVYKDDWRAAFQRLRATNNFPEFTGRICPAPCESACVLGITSLAVTIEQIEREIVEQAYAEGWIAPSPPSRRSGKSVAVIGSGPAGLACADQLNRAGHFVTVFERAARIGGLLRYGIPDFKLEKHVLDRRLAIMEAEGISFQPRTDIGSEPSELLKDFDAVVLCIGATRPRDIDVPGRHLEGIHFAMDFLKQQNERVSGDRGSQDVPINAQGRDVLVIGGGDTASDCIGTANRQGARSVTSFEILSAPPESRAHSNPWPFYANVFRVSSSHEEGCDRAWSLMTKAFDGRDGRVCAARTVDVEFADRPGARPQLVELERSDRSWPADLVLLAVGYGGPETDGVVSRLGVEIDDRGNIATKRGFQTSKPGIFSAGDARRGQSLVVWAISEGREAAREVDEYLCGSTKLPTKGNGDLPRA